ncbi:MAG: hypothetical protein VX822_01100 [Candidatus Neomarinimicrobiota bacterium]|nr:hypothetical protein [Candidatus Neomarinimicrobiota bacterium]
MNRILTYCGALAVLLIPQVSKACSVCFGVPSEQSITQGLDMAIVMLIGVTGTVLGGVVSFFIYMVRRGKRINQIMNLYDPSNGNGRAH